MYSRILVPLDGSEAAERVLPHAIAIARAFGASVTLLQATTPTQQLVAETASPVAPELGLDVARKRQEAEEGAAEAYLATIESRIAAEGIACDTAIDAGAPAWVILERARRGDISLIAMTTHGRSGLGRLVFGSVAEEVARNSPVPLLLVRIAD